MTEISVYDEKLRQYVSQTFGEPVRRYTRSLPPMYRFSDFVAEKHADSCHRFICESFRKREIPFPGNSIFYYTRTVPVSTQITGTRAYRTGYLSCVTETYVNTSFSDGRNTYRFRFSISGTFSAAEKYNLFMNTEPCRKKHQPDENLLSEYLIPYIKKENLDAEAETILNLFYPEALHTPVPVNACKLARNMGFTVRKARLNENNSKPGSIFFENRNICCTESGKLNVKTVPAGTILIDAAACRARGLNISDTIIHECVHAYEHSLFYCLQKSCLSGSTTEFPELEDYAESSAGDRTFQWIEQQAVHLSPRIRMPLRQTAVIAAELSGKYSFMSESSAREKITEELSEFYNVPKITAANRLRTVIRNNTDN